MKDYKFKIYGHRTERLAVRSAENERIAMGELINEIQYNNGWYIDTKTDTYLQVVHIKEIHEWWHSF